MKEIKLTQNKMALVDDEDFEYLNQWKWFAHKSPRNAKVYYGGRSIRGQKQILIHRVITDAPDGLKVDHINGDGLDNRKANLRICSNSQNGMNRGANKNSKSKEKCVSWHGKEKRWRVKIKANHKEFLIGHFKSKDDAIEAKRKAIVILHGEFAHF